MTRTARVLRNVVPFVFKPRLRADVPLTAQRRRIDQAALLTPRSPLVRHEVVRLASRPALRCAPRLGSAPSRTVLFVHGGAFGLGSMRSHAAMAGRLAADARAEVWLLDYRLAPEHPHPADVEDVVAAVQALRADRAGGDIALVGDSSGGGTIVGALVALRAAGQRMPACAAMLSPWLDLTLSGSSYEANRDTEVMADPDWLRVMAAQYVGGGDVGRINPLGQDLSGFPPLLVQVSADEVFLSDSEALAARAEAAGVPYRLQVWSGVWHNWHAAAPLVPESRRAMRIVGDFVAAHA